MKSSIFGMCCGNKSYHRGLVSKLRGSAANVLVRDLTGDTRRPQTVHILNDPGQFQAGGFNVAADWCTSIQYITFN